MADRATEITYLDFSGGMASSRPVTSVANNQAQLVRNIIIVPGDKETNGIQKRNGNTVFNSSAMASAAAVHGLGYFRKSDASEWLVAIAGATIQSSSSLSGTFSDVSAALTITTGQNNIWTASTMNDLIIFVGGAPDAPIKYSGTGNAAVLGGSPPSGNFGFTNNNRFFIGNTTANPSRIAWSILGSPEDWSSTGSGTQDIEKNDGDTLVGAAVLNNDVVLLFKQNSFHRFITRTSPFPYFPAVKGIGAIGKHAIVAIEGIAYFITAKARMKATDGTNVTDFPTDIDDIWDSIPVARLPYIFGFRYTGQGFDHLIWLVSTGASQTTNNLAIVWDLKYKCWLQHTTGYKMNLAIKTQSGVLYTGAYDGKVYKQDVASTFSDASETTPGVIDGLWRTGWKTNKSLQETIHISQINVMLLSQVSGTLRIGYGYDFSTDQYSSSIDMQAPGSKWDNFLWDVGTWGGQTDLIRSISTSGRGTSYQISLENNNPGETFTIHGYSSSIKKSGTKLFQTA